MYLIRVGKRLLNLEYLILAEEWDGTDDTAALAPGDVRVTMVSGRVLNLRNGDASAFLRSVEDVLPREEKAAPTDQTAGYIGRPLDPQTGQPLQRSGENMTGG